ncbi:MAG TPA: aspartate kinase, partial [Nitrosarchaeum sp.]|nr:aspartate kinase [Nitrosarchaeum sp.]
MKLVLKYGGTSISEPKKVKDIAKHLSSLKKGNQIVVVCSAISGVTDDLIQISKLIKNEKKSKETKQLTNKIIQNHKQFVQKTISKPNVRKQLLADLDSDFTKLSALVDGMILLWEITPRSLDYLVSYGERLSSKIVSAALVDAGIKSEPFTGKQIGIVTDSNFGESKPLMDTTRLRVSKNIDSLFTKKITPVVGGFAGADQHGRTTTFGRGGSDYSATTIASSIKADEIWLMSDV